MLKVLIVLLFVFSMLSFYNKKFKKLVYTNILVLIIATFIMSNGHTSVINSNVYLSCQYSSLISQYDSVAQQTANRNGISKALLFAQAITEQGLNFNKAKFLFGIKAGKAAGCESRSGSDSGVTWHGCLKTTKEEVNGKMITTKACFRCYNTAEDSIIDYGYWLTHNFKYRDKLKQAKTLEEQLKAIHGYATSSNYCNSLVKNINACNLAGKQLNASAICGGSGGGGNETPIGPGEEENYSTTFSGDINQGWMMYRAKQREEWKQSNKEIDEEGIDEAINEIFNRAEESYTGYIEYLKNKKIYFDPEEVGPYTGWLQTNPLWSGIPLGDSAYTMGSSGCAVTAVAIQFARMGFDVTPGSLVQFLNTHGGFESGGSGALKWNVATQFVKNVTYQGADSVYNNAGSDTNLKLRRIGELLSQGNKYIIVHINGGKTSNHWVAVTGVTENDLKIIDSGGFSSSDRTSFDKTFGLKNLDAKNIRIYTKN